ncbi:HAD family phosphatase [Romboutsia weinsteinii]|uniref:HAD family phosphatase n=1 Tax=Romboutsia weinsteinii TaxID=2020949 RepID=A0A371J4M1_9FIRM|nr:HAD family phosphatase [Romboutsia weinsteinii]RDY27685.1 HAD family phosphatase [Romboutsia weinsteinii]
MKGIIFDFNGTMFQDSHLHEEAWIYMVNKYASGSMTDEDILINLHGRTNKEILSHFISSSLTPDEIKKLSFEKESYYRELCLKHPKDLKLTNGLINVLNELKHREMLMTIATATVKENVDFYFDVFNLGNWFDLEKVVFDNGSFPGKPEPDIFLIASEKLKLKAKDCLVIEDAYSGLLAAKKAGIGKVIAIDPFNKNAGLFIENQMCRNGIINDFTTFFKVLNESNVDISC